MANPVKDKESLLALLRANEDKLKSYGVNRLGLFGSFVRDEPNEESDIDFMVEFVTGQKNFDNFMNLAFFLEELLGRKIELLTPQSLSPYIGPRILKEVEYVIAA